MLARGFAIVQRISHSIRAHRHGTTSSLVGIIGFNFLNTRRFTPHQNIMRRVRRLRHHPREVHHQFCHRIRVTPFNVNLPNFLLFYNT